MFCKKKLWREFCTCTHLREVCVLCFVPISSFQADGSKDVIIGKPMSRSTECTDCTSALLLTLNDGSQAKPSNWNSNWFSFCCKQCDKNQQPLKFCDVEGATYKNKKQSIDLYWKLHAWHLELVRNVSAGVFAECVSEKKSSLDNWKEAHFSLSINSCIRKLNPRSCVLCLVPSVISKRGL